jgi:hypothetical protein
MWRAKVRCSTFVSVLGVVAVAAVLVLRKLGAAVS